MNSDTCIILSHAPFEGTLHHWDHMSREEKQAMFDFCVRQAKEIKPHSRVLLSGHGELWPTEADSVVWQMQYLESEMGRGHPICVSQALRAAQAMDYKYVLKMRADTVIDDGESASIIQFCKDFLKHDSTKCLVTAQTIKDQQIGDLFMFGETDFLVDIWRPERWNYNYNGMINLYWIFRDLYDGDMTEYFSYVSVQDLGWRFASPDWMKHKGAMTDEHNWDKYYPSASNAADFYK